MFLVGCFLVDHVFSECFLLNIIHLYILSSWKKLIPFHQILINYSNTVIYDLYWNMILSLMNTIFHQPYLLRKIHTAKPGHWHNFPLAVYWTLCLKEWQKHYHTSPSPKSYIMSYKYKDCYNIKICISDNEPSSCNKLYHLIRFCLFEDLCKLSKSVFEGDRMGGSWASCTLCVTAGTGMCQ